MNLTANSPYDNDLFLRFKTGLLEQQRELQHAIKKAENEIREPAEVAPPDSLDASSLSASRDYMFTRAVQSRRQLRLVELALERIRSGSFGICVVCENAISLKRLQAAPWASHCIECQGQSERGGINGHFVNSPIPAAQTMSFGA